MRAPFVLAILGLLVLSPDSTVGDAPASNSNGGVVTQWVTRVRSFSSQWSRRGYSAKQIRRQKNVYPKHGDNLHAWAPLHSGSKKEFLEFEINTAVVVQTIEIFETNQAGSIVAVQAMNLTSGHWDTLFTEAPTRVKGSRIFSPTLQMKNYATNIFRLNMDCSKNEKKKWCELDAVRITGVAGSSATTSAATTAAATTTAPFNRCSNATCPILPRLLPCSESPSTPYFECYCTGSGFAQCQRAPVTSAMIQSAVDFFNREDIKTNAEFPGGADVVKMLLNGTGDVNVKYQNGMSALHLACAVGDVNAVKVLLDRGARTEDVDAIFHLTPLMLNTYLCVGNSDIVRVLIDRGARLDTKASKIRDRTALHFASLKGMLDVVKVLVEKGADVNAKDTEDNTPLTLASNRMNGPDGADHPELADIVTFLRNHGGTA